MTPEEFWRILFGPEAFKLEDWSPKYNNVDCIITPRRFREALHSLNEKIGQIKSDAYDAGYSDCSWGDGL